MEDCISFILRERFRHWRKRWGWMFELSWHKDSSEKELQIVLLLEKVKAEGARPRGWGDGCPPGNALCCLMPL